VSPRSQNVVIFGCQSEKQWLSFHGVGGRGTQADVVPVPHRHSPKKTSAVERRVETESASAAAHDPVARQQIHSLQDIATQLAARIEAMQTARPLVRSPSQG
jgi:hypothetical protein